MRITKTTYISGGEGGEKSFIRDKRELYFGEIEGKKVYIEVDSDHNHLDERDFLVSLEQLSTFNTYLGRPRHFEVYKSNNFNNFCLIKKNHTERKKYVKKYINEQILYYKNTMF